MDINIFYLIWELNYSNTREKVNGITNNECDYLCRYYEIYEHLQNY